MSLGLDADEFAIDGDNKKRKIGQTKKKTYVKFDKYFELFQKYRDGDYQFKRLFVMFVVSQFLAPMGDKSPNFNIIKSLEDVRFIRSYNWAGYVMDCLCDSIANFQTFAWKRKAEGGRKATSRQINGCLLAFVIVFLHKFDFGTTIDRKPFIMNWTCESLNERIRAVAENMDFGTLKLSRQTSPKQFGGKSDADVLKQFQLDDIEFKLEDSDDEKVCINKDGEATFRHFQPSDPRDKSRYVMYKITEDFPTDDKMDIDVSINVFFLLISDFNFIQLCHCSSQGLEYFSQKIELNDQIIDIFLFWY